MARGLGRCGRYAVLLAYVSVGVPLVRVLRELREARSRLEYVDEADRRVVASVSLQSLPLVQRLAGAGAFSSVAVEVKASCRLYLPPRSAVRALVGAGYRLGPAGGGGRLLYAVRSGRLVEVGVSEGRVKVKVGARATGTPSPPVPQGLFYLPPDEAPEAAEALASVLEELRRLLGSG